MCIRDSIDPDVHKASQKVYDKICRYAQHLSLIHILRVKILGKHTGGQRSAASVGAERCPPGTSAPRRGSST